MCGHHILIEFIGRNLESEINGIGGSSLKTAEHYLVLAVLEFTDNTVFENHKRLCGKVVELAEDISILNKSFCFESKLGAKHLSCTNGNFHARLYRLFRLRFRFRCLRLDAGESHCAGCQHRQ